MKRKLTLFTLILILAVTCALSLSACDLTEQNSIKAITKPYIAQYECVEATYGGKDVLKNFDFIRVTFLDGKQFEFSFKTKIGKKKAFVCNYKVDPVTREIDADGSVLGYEFQQSAVIKDGKFVVARPIMKKELVLKFEMS